MSLGAKVKAVLSGDTLVLVPPNAPQSKERTLSLAFVSAPRLTGGEVYGFESREALRTLLVGKTVQFKVLYEINGREYGDVSAPVFKSLVEKVVAEGTARVREDASNKAAYEAYEPLLTAAAQTATKTGVGLHSASQTISVASSAAELVGSQFDAIIERVTSGDRLQVRIIVDKKSRTHYVGAALVAGIRSPRSSTPDTPGEPLGDASKTFVEARLLQRSVMVTVVQISSTGIPIVTVSHPAGNIAELSLASGYSTIADWQSQFIGAQGMGVLRAAEKKAKDAGLGLWKGAAASSTGNSSAGSNGYEAVIAKVVSSDTFVLRLNSDQERTVQLASIRAPRKNDSAQAPYVAAAKEFARQKFIAKKVAVKVESVRPKSDQFEERQIVSIELQSKNIALTIVDAGYATVIRHRKDDTDRSPVWDELLEREAAATAAGKGIHSKKPPPVDRIVDASESVVKARGFLSSLERQPKIPAIVDYISSGSRMRLIVPRENCVLTLVLSGVKVPRPNEEYGDEALAFVSRRLLQRDVQFSVLTVDKTGAFVGHVFLPGKPSPLSLGLVAEGLASVHEYSAEQSGFYNGLVDAEKQALEARKGIWKDYQEQEADIAGSATGAPADAPTDGARKYVDVIVTDVSSTSGQLSYREASADTQFTKLTADLTSFNNSSANSTQFAFSGPVKRGASVTVKIDGFYRGKVLSYEKDRYTVQLIDTGRVVETSQKNLRPLPSQFASPAGLAKSADLTFIETPPSAYLDDYVTFVGQLKGKRAVANVDGAGSITVYTATSTGADDSLNAALVNDGYAFVKPNLNAIERSDALKPTLEGLKELEQGARRDHVGVWEYGDPRDIE